jgi:hypothetical protein
MMKRFLAALVASCAFAAPAFAGYARTVNETPYLAPFLDHLADVAGQHPLLSSFAYSEAPEHFSFENMNRLMQHGKCAAYSDQGVAIRVFVDMANRVLLNSDLRLASRVAYDFGMLMGDSGFLYCREEKNGWMSWSEYFYFVSNDGGFRVRFVLSEKD